MTDCKNLDLAREWAAGIDADRETLSQDTIDAAADLISSLPDQWVDAERLRVLIEEYGRIASSEGLETKHIFAGIRADLEALLPAPPKPRTLADMTPEERAECQWMQCEHPALDEPGVILQVWGDGCSVVSREGVVEQEALNHVTPLPNSPRMLWPEESYPEDGGEEVPESDPSGPEPEGNHLEHCASCTEMAEDNEPNFDPAYTYRDRDGDEWEYLYGQWVTGDTHAKRVAAQEDSPGLASLPAEYGPYTRIEE